MGRVFYTQAGEIPEGEPVMLGVFPIADHPVVMLFDSGASHTFINRTFIIKHEIPIGATKENFFIQSPGDVCCRCFVQAPASKFIVMRVRLGWCAKGHKIYTGLGRKSLRPVCCCSCY